jgi:hypothetical protein
MNETSGVETTAKYVRLGVQMGNWWLIGGSLLLVIAGAAVKFNWILRSNIAAQTTRSSLGLRRSKRFP